MLTISFGWKHELASALSVERWCAQLEEAGAFSGARANVGHECKFTSTQTMYARKIERKGATPARAMQMFPRRCPPRTGSPGFQDRWTQTRNTSLENDKAKDAFIW